MDFGLLELIIAATILLLLAIWWLWPRHDRGDLSAPPRTMRADSLAPDHDKSPVPEHFEAHLRSSDVSADAKRGEVRNEADYSEEDLMMRDVRAALHRGRKIEAIKRARQTLGISLAEAKDFVEKIDLPKGHGDI